MVCQKRSYETGIEMMSCPKNKVIQVTSSKYGHYGVNVCNAGPNPDDCSKHIDLTLFARSECDYKQQCVFGGKDSQGGDPCPYVPKYTRTEYNCIQSK